MERKEDNQQTVKLDEGVDWSSGYWGAVRSLLLRNSFTTQIGLMSRLMPIIEREHSAIAVMCKKVGSGIHVARSYFEPTLTTTKLLLLEISSHICNTLHHNALSEDDDVFTCPNTEDFIASEPASSSGPTKISANDCKALLCEVESSSVSNVKSVIHIALSIISQKIISQAPAGIRTMAGILSTDNSVVKNCVDQSLRYWNAIRTCEYYAADLCDLHSQTRATRECTVLRYALTCLECDSLSIDESVGKHARVTEILREKLSASVTEVCLPRTYDFIRELYSKGNLNTATVENCFAQIKEAQSGNKGQMSIRMAWLRIMYLVLAKTSNVPIVSEDRLSEIRKFEKGVIKSVKSKSESSKPEKKPNNLHRRQDRGVSAFHFPVPACEQEQLRDVFVDDQNLTRDEESYDANEKLCNEIGLGASGSAISTELSNVSDPNKLHLMQKAFLETLRRDDETLKLNQNPNLKSERVVRIEPTIDLWQQYSNMSPVEKKNSSVCRTSFSKTREMFCFWQKADSQARECTNKIDLSDMCVPGKSSLKFPYLGPENVFSSHAAILVLRNAIEHVTRVLKVEDPYSQIFQLDETDMPDPKERTEFSSNLRQTFDDMSLTACYQKLKSGQILEKRVVLGSEKKIENRLYYMVFCATDHAVFGLPLSVRSDLECESSNFTYVELVMPTGKQCFEPLTFFFTESFVHPLNPSTNYGGLVFVVKKKAQTLREWFLYQAPDKKELLHTQFVLQKKFPNIPPVSDTSDLPKLATSLLENPTESDLVKMQIAYLRKAEEAASHGKKKKAESNNPVDDSEDINKGGFEHLFSDWSWLDVGKNAVSADWHALERQEAFANHAKSKERQNKPKQEPAMTRAQRRKGTFLSTSTAEPDCGRFTNAHVYWVPTKSKYMVVVKDVAANPPRSHSKDFPYFSEEDKPRAEREAFAHRKMQMESLGIVVGHDPLTPRKLPDPKKKPNVSGNKRLGQRESDVGANSTSKKGKKEKA